MTLRDYFEKFQKYITGEQSHSFTMHVAAEIAAGYHIGLNFEQLKQFLARRTEITSVAIALKGEKLPVEMIERILQARIGGAVSPKELLSQAFSIEEVAEKFRDEIFDQ